MHLRKACLAFSILVTSFACQAPGPVDGTNLKVVGGVDATGWEWVTYHTVALSTLPMIAQGNSFCSGTLIAWNAVLTAAHCVSPPPENVFVVFGTRVVNLPSNRRRVVKIVKPNTYRPPTQHRTSPPHDISILFFEGLAPLGWRPAYIMPQNAVYPVAMPLLAAGYGMIWPNSPQTTGTLRWLPFNLRQALPITAEINVQAGWGRSTCQGDSGGPVYAVYNSFIRAVAGVTSWGASPCFYGNGHYVDLRYYNQWIWYVLANRTNPPGM